MGIFNESPSILLFVLVLFYLSAILLIDVVIRLLYLKEKITEKNIVTSKKVRLILLTFSILSVTVFFGLYKPYIPLTPIVPDYVTVISSIVIGFLIYILLLNLIKILLKNKIIKIKNSHYQVKNHTKYCFFTFIILIIASLFSYQSTLLINQNDHVILQNTASSNDFSKLAYVITSKNSVSLVVRDLNNGNTSIFSLCNSQKWCLRNSNINQEYKLNFYDKNTILISNDEILNSIKKVYYFDLNEKEIINEFDFKLGYIQKILAINSSLYYVSSFNNASVQLENIFTHEIFNFQLMDPQIKSISDLTISPDFTKIAVYYLSNNSIPKINYYTISNLKTTLVNTTTLYFNYEWFHFLPWTEQSAVYFSYFRLDFGSGTKLSYFNYTSNDSNSINAISTKLWITNINPKESIFTTLSPLRIYSYTNSTIKLLQDSTFYLDNADNSISKIISIKGSSLVLLNYNISTNSLKQKTLDISLLEKDYSIFNYLELLTLISTLIVGIATISFIVKDATEYSKYNS